MTKHLVVALLLISLGLCACTLFKIEIKPSTLEMEQAQPLAVDEAKCYPPKGNPSGKLP